jgi:WD40 repeat protein
MIASRDSTITFLNTHNDFKLIHSIKCDSKLGFASDEEEVNALVYLNFGSQTSYLAIGSTSGQLIILDLATMEPCFTEKNFIASETIFLRHRKSPNNACGQLISLNMDQNLFIYDIKEEAIAKGSLNRRVSLKKSGSFCLYLDEVIDVRFISETSKYALLCSNSETLKLLNMESNQIELYPGHNDIVLCLDVIKRVENDVEAIFLSGAKDNTIKMWKFDASKPF